MSRQLRAGPEISVVLSVRDDEEFIGHQVHALASHLRTLALDFEIVAVNNGSVDNSMPMLELMAMRMPEMRIVRASAVGRAFLRGASEARGAVILLVEACRPVSLGSLAGALARLAAGTDAVIVRGRYIVGRRLRVLPVIVRATVPGLLFERTFERTFERRAQDLAIDVIGPLPIRTVGVGRLFAPVLKFLAA